MSLPCDAQATHYDAGGGAVSGPFDFNLRYDHPTSSSFGGVYTTAVGTDFSADHTIHWDGSDWIYTDPTGDQWVGDFNADDPSGDYVDTSSGSSSSAITITVTTSDSCSSDSGSGSGSDSGSGSGSAKSGSSVSESDSSSGSGSGSGCPCYMVKILVDGSIRCIELTQTVDDYGNAYFSYGYDASYQGGAIVVKFSLGEWAVYLYPSFTGDTQETYFHEDDNDGDCPEFGVYTSVNHHSSDVGSTLELVRCDSCSSDSDSDSGSGSVSGSVSESDSASGSGSGSSP